MCKLWGLKGSQHRSDRPVSFASEDDSESGSASEVTRNVSSKTKEVFKQSMRKHGSARLHDSLSCPVRIMCH